MELEHAYCRNQQRSVADLLAFMRPYGGLVLPDGDFPVDGFLTRASLRQGPHATLPGSARTCHHNARAFARQHPAMVVFTGLAERRGIWVPHSWCEKNDTIYETTPHSRERYLGYALP